MRKYSIHKVPGAHLTFDQREILKFLTFPETTALQHCKLLLYPPVANRREAVAIVVRISPRLIVLPVYGLVPFISVLRFEIGVIADLRQRHLGILLEPRPSRTNWQIRLCRV